MVSNLLSSTGTITGLKIKCVMVNGARLYVKWLLATVTEAGPVMTLELLDTV